MAGAGRAGVALMVHRTLRRNVEMSISLRVMEFIRDDYLLREN